MTPRDDDPTSGAPEKSPYETEETVHRYERLAREQELFAGERKVLNRYFAKSDARVLDLGCGAGRTTNELDQRGFDVVGVDISEELVERGNTMFDHLDIRLGDATDLEFDAETFDYALFSYGGIDAIRPEKRRERAFEEIKRVLKPNGIFSYSNHNSLYTLPALFLDRDHVLNYYLLNGNLWNVGDRYKFSVYDYGVRWFFSTPLYQIRQLKNAGFDVLNIVGKRDSPLKYIEYQPYYVVRKPP